MKGAQIKIGEETLVEAIPLPEGVMCQLSEQSKKALPKVISKNSEISNLAEFTSHLVDKMTEKVDQLKKNPLQIGSSHVIVDSLQSVKRSLTGCLKVCPLCRRQCDVDHPSHEELNKRVHKCGMGHQIEGFGGNKHFATDEALTWPCDENSEFDRVVVKDKEMSFKEFKDLNPQWDLDSDSQDKRQADKLRFIKIWNTVGEALCSAYNSR